MKPKLQALATIFTTLTLVLALAASAQAQGLQVFTVSPNDDQLRQIDPVTGATLNSVTITLTGETVSGGMGLAVHPTSGTVFALLNLASSMNDVRRLVTINTGTGVATNIGDTDDGGGIVIDDIAFTDNGTLYGVSSATLGTGQDSLYTIDQMTGVPTIVAGITLTAGNTGHAIAGVGMVTLRHATGQGVQNTDEILEQVVPAGPTVTPMLYATADFGTALSAMSSSWPDSASFFRLVATSDNGGGVSDVFILGLPSSLGNLRQMASLDHVAEGIAITGTPPSCSPLQPLYGAAHRGVNGPSVFYSIDAATAAASMVGPIGFEKVSAMTYVLDGTANPSLFAVGERMDGSNQSVLLTIDPCTGAGTEIGSTGLGPGADFNDAAQSPDSGVLYAYVFGNGDLRSFDVSNGGSAFIGDAMLPFNGGHGLAFRSDFGVPTTLFHTTGDELDTVDVTTGLGAFSVMLTYPASLTNARLNALEVDPSSDVMFGSANLGFGGAAADNHLATVDTTTGNVVDLGSTQGGLDALAFSPQPFDISVSALSDDVDPVMNVGDPISYSINVANPANSFASDVQVTIDFSGAAVNITNATAGCTIAAPQVTCDFDAISANTTIGFGVNVTAQATGAIVVDVCTSTLSVDPDLSNNCDQETTAVGAGADVSVSKVENSADPITHAGVISYTITVTNNDATNNAGGVTVTDTFTGVAVTFNSATPSQGTCNMALPIVCNLGDIAAMGMATVDVMVNTAAIGTVTETASVTTITADATPANNTAVETTVVDGIDLVVTKTDSPDPIAVGGGDITYVVTVTNNGTIAATMVMLADNFTGAAANFVSATPSQGTCTPAFPAVPCDLGTINAGANATVTIVVTPTAGGTVTNTASATAAEMDPIPADNTNIAQDTTVAAAQGFTLTVTPGTITILPGQAAVFTVTITPTPFVASVTLSASGSIPLGSIAFGSSTLNPGNMVATTTMTADTTGFFMARHRLPNQSAPLYAYWLPATAGFGAFGLLLVGVNRKRLSGNRRAQFLATLSLLLAITLLAGCPLGRDREDEGTPGGTYPITVTATGGGVTQMVTVNVVVQGTN